MALSAVKATFHHTNRGQNVQKAALLVKIDNEFF